MGAFFTCAHHEGVRGSRSMAPFMLILALEEKSPRSTVNRTFGKVSKSET